MQELVPNIDPGVRIVAGTGSSAHLIGTALANGWTEYADHFTLFLLHEGGASPSNKYPGSKGRRLPVIWGEESVALEWQLLFKWRIGQSDTRVSCQSVPGAGHGLDARGREAIRAWLVQAASQ